MLNNHWLSAQNIELTIKIEQECPKNISIHKKEEMHPGKLNPRFEEPMQMTTPERSSLKRFIVCKTNASISPLYY